MLGDEAAARAALLQKASVADALAAASRRAEANSALARWVECLGLVGGGTGARVARLAAASKQRTCKVCGACGVCVCGGCRLGWVAW